MMKKSWMLASVIIFHLLYSKAFYIPGKNGKSGKNGKWVIAMVLVACGGCLLPIMDYEEEMKKGNMVSSHFSSCTHIYALDIHKE